MKNSFEDFSYYAAIVVFIGGIVLLVLLLIAEFTDYKTPNDYSYVDLDGNAGSADYCSSSRSGMWCKAGDRKVMVKEYSYQGEQK